MKQPISADWHNEAKKINLFKGGAGWRRTPRRREPRPSRDPRAIRRFLGSSSSMAALFNRSIIVICHKWAVSRCPSAAAKRQTATLRRRLSARDYGRTQLLDRDRLRPSAHRSRSQQWMGFGRASQAGRETPARSRAAWTARRHSAAGAGHRHYIRRTAIAPRFKFGPCPIRQVPVTAADDADGADANTGFRSADRSETPGSEPISAFQNTKLLHC
jgi:hypothetical protein